MCNEYVEPCLLLAIHHKEQKQYDLSLKYFRKAESKDFTDVYREIRYLYNRSYLNDRGKLNEYTDKMDSAKSSLCGEIYCLTKH
jgi:predicted RNA-binding protein with EMAP domain